MRQKPLPWPPNQGEIWVAMSAWCVNGDRMNITVGTQLLVVTEPNVHSFKDDTWAMEVIWSGGTRRIVAGPDDLMPLEWMATDGDT